MLDRRFLFPFVLFVLTLFLMAYQDTRGRIVITQLETPIVVFKKRILHLWDKTRSFFRDREELTEKNRLLEEKIREYEFKITQLKELVKENDRLRKLLGFKSSRTDVVASAEIVSIASDRWKEFLLLNKGYKDGIRKDMAVITPEGLLGKITEVQKEYSKVLLLTDVNFSVAVLVKDKGIHALLSGKGMSKCELKYVNINEQIEKGYTLITSGRDGLFPSGIPVGIIDSVDRGDSLFYKITVKPFVEPWKVREVMVVKKR